MKSGSSEKPPPRVPPEGARQGGESQARKSWEEPAVWTERMLAALRRGVKGDVWFSLMDKVYSPRALRSAWEKVRRKRKGGGVDRQTIEQFERREKTELDRLQAQLKVGTYRPWPVKRVWLPKPGGGRRPIGKPVIRDKIVQTALKQVLEPIFEQEFCEHSYGFRPERGAKDALRRVDRLLKSGYTWVVDADVKSYFDTIPHDRLMACIEERVADGSVLELIRSFLKQGVLEDLRYWTPTEGTPQGAVLSPLLANIYLHPLDRLMEEAGYEMVRYADDFVVLCRTEEEARKALEEIRRWMEEAGLSLHPEKTRIVDATERGGFDFLGYHFERGMRWPRKSSLKKFKDAIRCKTKRTNGYKLEEIIRSVNATTRGWFEYFKHSHRYTFPPMDGWIRMRLRSILRRRDNRRGVGRGYDHQRWPNTFFAKAGLFTMTEAWRELVRQPR